MQTGHGGLSTPSLLAVAALAAVVGDTGHELAHTVVAIFTPGVSVRLLSTIGLSSVGTSPWIALAGPAFNLCAALTLALARRAGLPASWRYVAWVVGAFNLFNAAAYLVYSALLGSGDWATVFAAIGNSVAWRIPLGVAGVVAYWAAMRTSSASLATLCADGVVSAAQATRVCRLSYLGFGGLLTLGALFNPVGWMLVLSSGVATGFLAMAGMLALPALLPATPMQRGMLQLGIGWRIAGALASLWFVAVLGPGIRLG
ncbi:hypothetical protein J7373_06420 [Xanthomonas sp. A2111]|uniref:Uncharacterized protein n=1 Tax=Xanthomonas hawaiiensis TaxID=3003247 RepID=A0ABU2I0D3_9XANT|nr:MULTISPECIES: hypothetical protein [unclassified Xanthomonas]MBO9827885.1 hypothetical protein [Xanthomonas sp. A2111]MBO9875749.1 hypothetical protein [Xanthomonas sp. D-93]MDS9991601.1 hypothetical protein [Xanthomonas sp. A2111]WNH43421.1 hypothetical protein PG878_12880 [Xanthomonas sp. A6251]